MNTILVVDPGVPGLAQLRLDRPAQRNAMSGALIDALMGLLDAIESDESINAVILGGEGRGFCAGSDLADLAAMDDGARSGFEDASGRLARRISSFPRPVLAAVHGFAIGGGLTLAAACDVVITTADAKWSLPEVPIGLFPAWGLAGVADRIGRSRARRLAWGIDVLDGRQAAAIGLADIVADDPAAAARAVGEKLAGLPRAQSAAVKRYFSAPQAEEEADRHANRLFIEACSTPQAAASFGHFGRKPAD